RVGDVVVVSFCIRTIYHNFDPSTSKTFEKFGLVDRFLDSPHYGERWARHWMDWWRYADSHGSEGDPAIPYAWRYRDYLIRALNSDVPYDQLVREHLAGDLMTAPRVNVEKKINESILGTAHFRFVFHGFAPTDPLDEQVRFTDNQIDVVSKALMGITVSCARCHNHKFDAISQKDFYALYGVFASCRPALVTIDSSDHLNSMDSQLGYRTARIKAILADAWSAEIDQGIDSAKLNHLASENSDDTNLDPLAIWKQLNGLEDEAFKNTWMNLVKDWNKSRHRLGLHRNRNYPHRWDLGTADASEWFYSGSGLNGRPVSAGEFHILPEGDRFITDILPRGIFTHLLSSRQNGVLASPRFLFKDNIIYLRLRGDQDAKARYAVQNYPRNGTVYPIQNLKGGRSQWKKWDVTYWDGDYAHLEIVTAGDGPIVMNPGRDRSWFGVQEAVLVSCDQEDRGEVPRDEMAEFTTPLFEAAKVNPPAHSDDLNDLFQLAVLHCIEDWRNNVLSDAGANFLSTFIKNGLLSSTLKNLPKLREDVAAYRQLESKVPVPKRAPGILESRGFDQPLFIRGDHKKPGEPVPRRFLEVFGGQPFETLQSGRAELAEEILSENNPLTARVIVNRIWHHLFGRGIVASTDNFGRLGEKPTHPELLDNLAERLRESDWSIKKLIRFIVTSRTFRMDSVGTEKSRSNDPDNRWLSRFPIRRMEAESIRDAILFTSGQLNLEMYGPGQSTMGRRRSIYLGIRRNRLDPFLAAFDFPEPLTTRGRRNITNVPGQSLMLLNDPFVIDLARSWSEAVLRDTGNQSDKQRIKAMYASALGRFPLPGENQKALEFISGLEMVYSKIEQEIADLKSEITDLSEQLGFLVEPVRTALLADRQSTESRSTVSIELAPVALWDFPKGKDDQIGNIRSYLKGHARLDDGALVLNGKDAYLVTDPLPFSIKEKTMEVWLQLTTFDQRGGGVMSLQTPDGIIFDSLVFGEMNPQEWLAGSNNFQRTRSLQGMRETEALGKYVHLVLCYSKDGFIQAYREGQAYGKPYKANETVTFNSGKTVILLGCRHSPPKGGSLLKGRIMEARLYDRVLSGEEVKTSFNGATGGFVSNREIEQTMDAGDLDKKHGYEDDLKALSGKLERLEKRMPMEGSHQRSWQDVAQ
ncbi:MAG TPA: DUF1553 domain-containing protein, partial [Verrucomicrobia bacterium]|nr:DUF1553 domain-containing protein [Verrucomicrobiota bacterium]